MKDTILIEHCLVDKEGHYFEYDSALKYAFDRAGHTCTIIANRCLDEKIRAELGVIPYFSWRFNGRYPPWFRYLKRFAGLGQRLWISQIYSRYRRDLSGLKSVVQWNRHSLLFFPTVLPAEALAVVQWFDEMPAECRPLLGIFLRFPMRQQYFGNRWSEEVYRRLFREADTCAGAERIRWFSDSSRLVQQYEQCGGKEFIVLPIPHSPVPADSAEGKLGNTGEGIDFRFLGRAVPEKGYTLLPDIFAPFAEDIAQGRLQLTVQAGEEATGDLRVDKATERLKGLGTRFLGRVLNSEEYRQATAAADVVLLPYWRRENEYAGTSAVFADALARGKPVIVTADTWMGDQFAEFGSGFAVASGDIEGFREAVRRCLESYPELQRKAMEAAPPWCRIHNADTFVSRVLDAYR